jgi:hypothetical protein
MNTIKSIEWGKITLDNGKIFKDVMLAPDFYCEWDWKVNGTSHGKGIAIADIEVLLKKGIEALVLSRGYDLVLSISKETCTYALSNVTTVIIDKSDGAVEHYNRLVSQNVKVGALIHSTC